MTSKPVNIILEELKQGLKHIYGKKLKGVYLFGSYARDEQDPESDFDILIVLDEFDLYSAEIKRTGELISKLSLKYGLSISRKVVKDSHWQKADTALLRNVRAEAIAA